MTTAFVSRAFADDAANFHPYECNGPGKCPHCDRRDDGNHDPRICALCDPAYDFQPNAYRENA